MNHIASNWALSSDDYEKYTSIFIASDTQKCGILSGGQARELLSQSGLPPHVLFQVWNLADPQQTGFLDPPRFAIAMHLIFQKLAGHNLPLQLPSELQPQKLEQFQTKNSPVPDNLQPTQSDTCNKTNSDINKRIVKLETELNKKRLLVTKKAVPPPLNDFELTSLMNKIKEQHTKIPVFSKKVNLLLDSHWTPDLTTVSKLESELPNISRVAELIQESKTILEDILSSGKELFALEDAQTHGYTLPAEGAKLPVIPLPTSGDSVIAQKAAAMLAQRMQALQLGSTAGPIPSDAQRRLEAHHSVLESQKKSGFLRATNLKNSICSQHQTFQMKSSQYKLGNFGADVELRQEFDLWRNFDGNFSSSTNTFIKSLVTDNEPNVQQANVLNCDSIPDSPVSPTPRAPISVLAAKPLARLKPTFPKKKPPPPQRSAPIPKIASKSSVSEPPADDFTVIAQASRLARVKAQQLERSQTLSANTQPKTNLKPKPKPKRPPPTPPPKVTSEELSRQQDQQQGPSVDEIRAAARRARALAQTNLEVSQNISNLSKTSASVPKKVPPPPVKQKPNHLQNSSKNNKPPETHRKVVPNSIELSKLEHTESKRVSKDIQPKVEQSYSGEVYPKSLPETLDSQIEEFTQVKEIEANYHECLASSIESPSSGRPSFESNSGVEASAVNLPEETKSDFTLTENSTQNHSQASFEKIPSPEKPWLVQANYDYANEEGFCFQAGATVVVTELPPDAPDWCLGHVNDSTGWIPLTYLDLPHVSVPEETLGEVSAVDSDITVQNETINWATLLEPFTAEVEGEELIDFEAGKVQIVDTSNPDWHLAKHPAFGSLAYLPKDILSYSITSNPFARQSNFEDQTYSCYSDTDASELQSTEEMPKAHSAHHLPLLDYQEASSPHRLGWASQVDSAVLEGLSKTEIQRLEAVHELVTTEKTYLRDMQLVVDVFYLPLEQLAGRSELALIFANLPELVVVNTLFLSELESLGTDGVGTAFLSHVSEFQAYGTYCGNQAAASRYLQSNHPYINFLNQASNRPECRMLDLASFLLQPVQRITRYPLLLKQIFKYTPQSHPEFPTLQEAISKAESTLQQINREAYANENIQQLRELESQIDLSAYNDFRLSDLTSHLGPRQAIIDGPLSKHRSSRTLHGFLFNDVFLLAQSISSPDYQFELYRPPMPLILLKVRDAQTSHGRRDDTCFQVVSAKEILTLKATTASTKKKWLSEFNKAIKSATAYDSAH